MCWASRWLGLRSRDNDYLWLMSPLSRWFVAVECLTNQASLTGGRKLVRLHAAEPRE